MNSGERYFGGVHDSAKNRVKTVKGATINGTDNRSIRSQRGERRRETTFRKIAEFLFSGASLMFRRLSPVCQTVTLKL